MNKVIKELYRRAHTTRHYDGDPALDGNPPTVYWQDEVSAERFAKLIIQQCITQVALIGVSNFENENIMWTVETAIASIETHFGMNP